MAVRIPRIKQIQSSGTLPQNDRIKGTVQDQSSAILNQTRGIASVVETGIKVNEEIENNKIDQLGYEDKRNFTLWDNQELAKLRTINPNAPDTFLESNTAIFFPNSSLTFSAALTLLKKVPLNFSVK